MCIAIVKTKDGKITDEQLKNCFTNNPDGAGVAYSVDGQLYMIKGIFNEDNFIKAVRYAEELADGAMLIHCRISTSGKVDETNCHPHVVHDNCVMIHNGVLNIKVPKDSEVSDTVLFTQGLLAPLPRDFMFNKAILDLIEFTIGSNNKFCFLHANGEYAICNESAGEWKDGVWFSNDSYEDYYSRFSWYGNGYYEDGYETWRDYYKNYADYRDEAVECEYKASFNEDEYTAIEKLILNLTPDELIALGEDPVVYRKELTLYPTDTVVDEYDDNVNYLSCLDDMLYDMYYEFYESAWINLPDVAEEILDEDEIVTPAAIE